MHREHTGGLAPTAIPGTDAAALVDFEALVEEIGGNYPMLGYTVRPEDDVDEETLDPHILAGLVSP
jgi:hypothetical protein